MSFFKRMHSYYDVFVFRGDSYNFQGESTSGFVVYYTKQMGTSEPLARWDFFAGIALAIRYIDETCVGPRFNHLRSLDSSLPEGISLLHNGSGTLGSFRSLDDSDMRNLRNQFKIGS